MKRTVRSVYSSHAVKTVSITMGRNLQTCLVAWIILSNMSIGGDYPHKVNGVIGGTIELVIKRTFSDNATEVVWKLKRGSQTFKIAEFKDNNLRTEHPQIQMFRDGMVLRIKNATFDNIGNYTAKITLKNNVIEDVSFIVSLYEPVPFPTIRIDYEDGTNNTCNVTLHCDVTANTSVSYIWEYKNGSEYQRYESTVGTVQVTRQPEPMEVQCTVHNPADSKYVSVPLKPCQQKVTESHHTRHHWPVVGAVLFVVGVACIIHLIHFKTQLKKSVQETDGHIVIPRQKKDPQEEY